MNINEVQLWRLNMSTVKLENVARTGKARVVQGHADRYFNNLAGVSSPATAPFNGGAAYSAQAVASVINGVPFKKNPKGGNYGFQFTTIPIGKTMWNGFAYPKISKYPIIRITLESPVPYGELLSTVIFNRTDGATTRLGKDLVILNGKDKVVSKVQLPDYTAVPSNQADRRPKYVRVDYKPASFLKSFVTKTVGQANDKIIDVAKDTQVNQA